MRRRRPRPTGSWTLPALLLAGVIVALGAATPVHAADAWWMRVGLRGEVIDAVGASGRTLTVRTASGQTLRSGDAGRSFSAVAGVALPTPGKVLSGPDTWSIDASGHVLHGTPGAAPKRDPSAPPLGAGAHLIAAPAAIAGVVVAVSADGTVWRRGQDGDWKQALLLLPQSLVQGVPRVTSLTAFTRPLSDTVYMGTDGYSVLISTDGGDDWIRAGPGLPDSVYALASDPATHSVYAGTSDGLWVHLLQALPSPPAYADAALLWRWLGIGAVTVVASMLTLLGLARVPARSPAPPAATGRT